MIDIREEIFDNLCSLDHDIRKIDSDFNGEIIYELDHYLWFPLADEIDDDLDMSLDNVIDYVTYD